jgi:hypothetical protein
MKFITKLITPVAILAFVVAGALAFGGESVLALDPADGVNSGIDAAGGGAGSGNLRVGIKDVINTLLFILGAIAVIMIVIGGIKYTLSNGDASSIKSAKDTILYSVIGLVVALLAYAIVNFVVDQFS